MGETRGKALSKKELREEFNCNYPVNEVNSTF